MAEGLYPGLFEAGTKRYHPIPKALGAVLVGRSEEAAIRIADPTFSRKQFLLSRKGDGIWVEDASKRKGTARNHAPLLEPALLRHGDILTGGDVDFIFLERPDGALLGKRETPGIAAAVDDGKTLVGQKDRRAVPAAGAEGEYPLPKRTFTIGRQKERSDLALPHPQVSRLHAEIQPEGGGHTLGDLRSANGTFLNGERIARPAKLKAGDRILIGPYTLTYTGSALAVGSSDGNLTLAIEDLTRTVSDRSSGKPLRILDRVSLVVQPEDFVCILGPSGSGKSTLMNAASGRVLATSGSVSLNGLDLYDNFDALKKNIAYVPQKEAVHGMLSVEEALRFSARLRLPPDISGDEIEENIGRVLETLKLEERRRTPIRDLSGGQLRRVSLANEIISRPSLLFLDEVTSGLDELTDREVMAAIRDIADSGKTVICISHTLSNIEGNANLVVYLTVGGKLAFFGSPSDALRYFSVPRLGDVYEKLREKPAEAWQEEFRSSEGFDANIRARLPSRKKSRERREEDPLELRTRTRKQFWRQLIILLERGARLLGRDPRSLLLLFGQPVLVGLLIAILFGSLEGLEDAVKAGRAANVLFLLSISCIWFGCNNSAKEIVKEKAIYSQERDAALQIPSYYLSKVILLGALCSIQALLILSILKVLCGLPGSAPLQFAISWLGAFSGTLLGLFISSLSPSPDVAVQIVPIALIPQVIFAGVILPLEGAAKLLAWLLVPNYWTLQALERTLPQKHVDLLGDPKNLAVSVMALLVMASALAALNLLSLWRADARFRRR